MGRGSRTEENSGLVIATPSQAADEIRHKRNPGEISLLTPLSASYYLKNIDKKIATLNNDLLKNTSSQIHLMIDLDSTLYAIADAMRIIGKHDHILPENIKQYNDLYALSSAEAIYESCRIETMRQMGLMPGAIQAVKKLEEHGVQIHYLTHRSNDLHNETKQFLEEEGLKVGPFFCDLEIDKISYCLENNIRYIADDKPDTIEKAIKNKISAHSIAWQYNNSTLKAHNIALTKNWFELLDSIMKTMEADLRGEQ